MSLSAWERRELEAIEQELSLADPRLAELLAAPIDHGTRYACGLAGGFVAVAVLLIVGGLLLVDGDMVIGGLLVLVMMPFTVRLVVAVRSRGL